MDSFQKEVPTAYDQLNYDILTKIVENVENITPVYVYFQNYLIQQARILITNFKKN